MKAYWIDQHASSSTETPADAFIACSLAAAQAGDCGAYFDLGVALSTGANGLPCDFVEAHKWFNIAATSGHEESALCRSDVAQEMTAREIAEAQRRARQWLSYAPRQAA
jgi:TPR repeat protein